MGLLRVDVEGLGTLAGECESLAGELASAAAPAGAGPSFQATSTAVTAVHGDVGATGAALIARMQATAAKLTAASTAYAAQDMGAASKVDAAGETLKV